VKLLQSRPPEAASSFFEILLEKVSGRSNIFIISKRHSSLRKKFYDRKQALQAETIYDIIRTD